MNGLLSAQPLTQPLPSSPDIDVQYAYDDDGKEKQVYVTNAGYNLNYHYDGQGRFDQIQNAGGTPLFTYTYDAASNEIHRTNNVTGVDQDYEHPFVPDALNRIKERDVKSNTGSVISHEGYDYDPQKPGLLTSVTRQEQNQTQIQDLFAYDLTGEITNAQYGIPSGGSAARTCGYVWDKAGNRTSMSDGGTTTIYQTDNLNQYLMSEQIS